MREAGDVLKSDVYKDGTGMVEYLRYDDMKYAIKKLDDTKFKSHEVALPSVLFKSHFREKLLTFASAKQTTAMMLVGAVVVAAVVTVLDLHVVDAIHRNTVHVEVLDLVPAPARSNVSRNGGNIYKITYGILTVAFFYIAVCLMLE